jgi:hypothetical protein
MHKPDKPLDPIEEVENILTRLVPAAMSERATHANDSMIDGLVGTQASGMKIISKPRYWWQAGIAASLIAGVGLVFLDRPEANAGALGQYEFVKTIKSTMRTSDDIWVEQADEIPLSAADYKAEDINVIRDKKNDFVMLIGWYFHFGCWVYASRRTPSRRKTQASLLMLRLKKSCRADRASCYRRRHLESHCKSPIRW